MSRGSILVDTNVVSELMRASPAPAVIGWFALHAPSNLFLTAVTEAELRAGVAYLPEGRRREQLARAINAMVEVDFAGRVLPFDSAAAKAYAAIAAMRRGVGRPIAEADCQIAAIASARGAVVATHNVRDFDGCGIGVVDPWDLEAGASAGT